MNVLDRIAEESRQHYYELCITHKDWEHGDLRSALDFIAGKHQQGELSELLEVGCGHSDIIPHLAGGVRYTGLDPTKDAIVHSQREYPQHHFVRGFSENLPFADSAFDAVFSYQTLQSFSKPQEALSEIARVIRPGGYAILLAPNLECPWATIHSTRHYGMLRKIHFGAQRWADLFLRFFGVSVFRLVLNTYAEEIGRYEKKDDDLKYVTSAWEAMKFMRGLDFHDLATRKTSYRMFRHIGPLRYYGGGMMLILEKNYA